MEAEIFQLKTSIETHNFPIFCAACEKPFTWLDLEFLLLGDLDRNKDEDPQKLQSLSDASLACFIERHGGLYKHCLSPDCRGLHKVSYSHILYFLQQAVMSSQAFMLIRNTSSLIFNINKVTMDAGVGQCRLCGRIQCTKCGNEEHEPIACEEYARLRVNADESVRKWIQ